MAIFNLNEINAVPFDSAQELANALRTNTIVWCWGAENWTLIDNKALRFKSNGYLHKGHVYITVNGLDLFDIYITTLSGKIKEVIKDVYLDDLIEVIDRRIETL
jgi:hypothetical protein